MNDYKVIDNFCDLEFYKKLKNLITHEDFPWRRRLKTVEEDINSLGYFTHNFYNNAQIQSECFEPFIIPILQKLNARAVIQVRANLDFERLYLKKNSLYHIDNFDDHFTSILNLSENGGGTELKLKNEEIFLKSKENRMIIFKSNIMHRAVKPDANKVRYLINFNYY